MLYGDFAESWRIQQAVSIFTYFEPDESTETYTDRNFPPVILTAKDLPEDQYNQAKIICENAGISNPVHLDSCILDVGLTGDEDFAKGFSEAKTPEVAAEYEPSPPTIIRKSLPENAVEVSIKPVITISFSKPMDASSITSESFTLNNDTRGTVSYDSANMTAKFEPLTDLAYNTIYTVIITNEVRDAAGNYLDTDYTWKFTTINTTETSQTSSSSSGGGGCFINTLNY